jgi:hypothetical protein
MQFTNKPQRTKNNAKIGRDHQVKFVCKHVKKEWFGLMSSCRLQPQQGKHIVVKKILQ